MTATLTVIGNGRVLNRSELVGRGIVYYLTITYAGRVFRWSFPGTRDVWETAADGDTLHFVGMDQPDVAQGFDFVSDSPTDLSVSVEDLVFPGELNLPLLIAQGHRLELAEGELAVLPDNPDALWSERLVLLQGEISEPVHGDPETHPNAVSFSLESPSWEDGALFPPADWVVTEEQWPLADDSSIGRVFPFVFGAPGVYRLASGTQTYTLKGTPAIHVGGDVIMIAGHQVAPDTLDTGTFPNMILRDATDNDDATPSNQAVWTNTGGSLTNAIASGFKFTALDLAGSVYGSYRSGNEYWVSNWAELDLDEPTRVTIGGYPAFDWNGPLRTAGDLLFFMLLQSDLQVDRGRCAIAQDLLQAYEVGGYIDDRVVPYEWITDNLLPILPVAMSSGPKGIFPIVWRYNAKKADCVAAITEGPRWRRVSGIETDESGLCNEFTLKYALDGDTCKQSYTVTGYTDELGNYAGDYEGDSNTFIIPNGLARKSFLHYGKVFAEDDSSDIVYWAETAVQICTWKVLAGSFAKQTITYEASFEYAWLEPGAAILLTDNDTDEVCLSGQVCLIRKKTWDVTSLLFEVLILPDPARDSRVIV